MTTTFAQIDAEISEQRARLTPFLAVLREDAAAVYWESFGAAAAMLRRAAGAQNSGRAFDAFNGVCRELRRDARGDASNPSVKRESAAPVIPPRPARAPWATMPVDGSGAPGRIERAFLVLVGVACTVALLWVGVMIGSSDRAGGTAGAVTVTAGDVFPGSADLITRGGYWTWSVADACGRSSAECDATLRAVNKEAAPFGLVVMEDGSIASAGEDY